MLHRWNLVTTKSYLEVIKILTHAMSFQTLPLVRNLIYRIPSTAQIYLDVGLPEWVWPCSLWEMYVVTNYYIEITPWNFCDMLIKSSTISFFLCQKGQCSCEFLLFSAHVTTPFSNDCTKGGTTASIIELLILFRAL